MQTKDCRTERFFNGRCRYFRVCRCVSVPVTHISHSVTQPFSLSPEKKQEERMIWISSL